MAGNPSKPSEPRHALGKVFANESGERIDVRHASEAFAANQHDLATHTLPRKLPIAHQVPQTIVGCNCEPRNQSVSKAGRDEVPQRFEARGLELSKISPPVRRACFHYLIAQAMSVFEQNHLFGMEVLHAKRFLRRQFMTFRRGKQEWFVKQRYQP